MTYLKPVLLELKGDMDNLLIISHQTVLRCLLGYFLNKKHGNLTQNSLIYLFLHICVPCKMYFAEELPYFNVPLHTIIKLTISGYKCKMDVVKLNIECMDITQGT